ncbi:MAG: thioredoxin-disulfide reductase, partial [Halovenus sp.]
KTTADGVYAVGDLTPGNNQIPVAMGKGAKAGISIHMELRTYPKSLDELEAGGEIEAAAADDD